MADENIAEWAHVFGVEAATIRCVLVAAEAGEIELPPIGERGRNSPLAGSSPTPPSPLRTT